MNRFKFPRRGRQLPLTRLEAGLLMGAAALLAFALWGPVVSDSVHQHGFADQRAWGGIPNLFDVLSNVPFVLAGTWGLVLLHGAPPHRLEATTHALVVLFCGGLLCAAVGSMGYHCQPRDATLIWDRLGMVLPFAGLLGLAASSRVSQRAGCATAVVVLALGLLAVLTWERSGNVLPWAVVQLGGALVVLALAALHPRAKALSIHLGAVIGLYALAKLFEAADHAVFEATYGWVSGHTIKHLLASSAAWPVLSSLRALQGGRAADNLQVTTAVQNGDHSGRGAHRASV
jgi:hypothetical protein